MLNIRIFLTFLVVVLCLGIYTLLAEYKIQGNLSVTSHSSSDGNSFQANSRIGEPVSGSSGNSGMNVRSGLGSFDRAMRASEFGEVLSSTEDLSQGDEAQQNVPTEFRLYENYPNPFNPMTTIRFDIPTPSNVTIDVYDIRGQRVAVLLAGEHIEPGSYQVNFDASRLSTGIYLYRIGAGAFQNVKKMMLMK